MTEAEENRQDIKELRTCVNEMKISLDSLHKEHTAIRQDISEMLIIFSTSKSAFKFFGWIAQGLKWLAAIGVSIGLIVGWMKGWIK